MAQYDPIAAKNGILTVLGTDTLRDDRVAVAGLDTTTNSLVSGDVVQVDSTALRMKKAVNTSTSPIVGVYDGISGSVVRRGVVVATFKSGLTLANGDAVYLSATAGALTNVKPTKDKLHEVGVIVDATNKKILLQQKPVIALPDSPPLSGWFWGDSQLRQVSSPAGSLLWSGTPSLTWQAGVWDGDYIWVAGGVPTKVWKFDPGTRTIVAGPFTIYGDDFGNSYPNVRSLAFDGSDYWIVGAFGNSVYKFKPDGTVLGQVTGTGATYNGHSMGLCYDGLRHIICHRSGDWNTAVYRIDCGDPGASIPDSKTTIANGWGAAGNTGYYGVICGGYYYWLTGDKGWPSYTPWPMYLNRVNLSGTPVASHSDQLYNGSPGNLITDGTYVYTSDGGYGIMKFDPSYWPNVGANRIWYVGGGQFAMSNTDYDGLYIWGLGNGSYNYWRISTTDGSRSNFAPTYWGVGLVNNGRVLP